MFVPSSTTPEELHFIEDNASIADSILEITGYLDYGHESA